jgi:hypothetical protein
MLDSSFSSAHADFGNVRGIRAPIRRGAAVAKHLLPLVSNQSTAHHHVGEHLVWLDDDSRAETLLAAHGDFRRRRACSSCCPTPSPPGRTEAALGRSRRTVGRGPNNVEALLTRVEVAPIVGSSDTYRFADPQKAEVKEGDVPTQLIWHSVRVAVRIRAVQAGSEGPRVRVDGSGAGLRRGSHQGGCADWLVRASRT